MVEIGNLAMANGWESYVAYSRGRDGIMVCPSHTIPVGSKASVAWHVLQTRLLDRHGLSSSAATRRFIRELERIDPNVIHIHNIHGYFLNYKLLFDYLAGSGKPVVWTVHDCWLYTGHCFHYDAVNCDRWKQGCNHCPQRTAFPKSFLADRSAQNYRDKKAAFTSIDPEKFVVVTVSEWMRNEMKDSFLKDCRFRIIHNGIDTDVFRPTAVNPFSDLGKKHVLLGVASIWNKEKGLEDFARMATMLGEDEVLVLVGLTAAQRSTLPNNIVGIPRTESAQQLAELYAAADVFINLTYQDNYPTVNMEALACGTPVITYATGGSVESVNEQTGFILEQGDIEGVLQAARTICREGKEKWTGPCREYAIEHFSKDQCYKQYIELYNSLTE